MKRLLVVLACIAVLIAGVSAGVGAQSGETGEPYSLNAAGSVPVHDRQANVGGTDVNVSSLVGLYPGEEVLVDVTAPDDELPVVTVRTTNGTVLQKDSVTDGEDVLVDSTEYDPGTYYLVLSTGGRVRAVSLLVVSKYRVSYGLGNVTDGNITGDATVAGGIDDGESVQFVLSNEENETRANATELRRGLYDFSLALDDVPDGNYTAVVEVVGETSANGSRTILATSRVRTVTVGQDFIGVNADAANGTGAAADDSADAETGTSTDGDTGNEASGTSGGGGDGATESASTGPENESGTAAENDEAGAFTGLAMPDPGPVVLFGALVSWAVVARLRRR